MDNGIEPEQEEHRVLTLEEALARLNEVPWEFDPLATEEDWKEIYRQSWERAQQALKRK